MREQQKPFLIDAQTTALGNADTNRAEVKNNPIDPQTGLPQHDITDPGYYPWSGFQTYVKDSGVYTETSGIITDFLNAQAEDNKFSKYIWPFGIDPKLDEQARAAAERLANIQEQLWQLTLPGMNQ